MKRVLLYLLVATIVVACSRDNVNVNGGETIECTIADYNVNTRVELNENQKTVWNNNDEICVFHDNVAKIYRYTGKSGEYIGSFSLVESQIISADDAASSSYHAVYPAPNLDELTPQLYANVPAVQQYKRGSYGLHANAMVGTSSDGKSFTFTNVVGYVCLPITGSKVVKSITLEGNGNENIAGKSFIKDGTTTVDNSSASKSITIDCGEGVQLTDQPTDFYFAMFPQTFNEGLTVTITLTDGTIFPKSTSKKNTIRRNTISSLTPINIDDDVVWQTITIDHSGERVYAPQFSGGADLSGIIYWGDSFMTNINKVTSYTYTDGVPSHTITTKSIDANSVEINNCRGISAIDFTNF